MIGMLRGSFKNNNFYVKKETIENIGLKQIIHDYPNTKVRYVESQSETPFSCTIDIFFGDRDSYDAFISAIKDPQAGRLILPVYGIVNNIKVMPANTDIDYTLLGRYSMTVTFSESSDRPAPTVAESTSTDVSNLGEAGRQEIKSNIVRIYSVPSSVLSAIAIVSDAVVLSQILFNIIKDRIFLSKFANGFQKKIQSADLLANFLLSNTEPVGFLYDISNKISSFETYKYIAIIGNNLPSEMYDVLSGDLLKYNLENSTREINFTVSSWGTGTLERDEKTENRYLIINAFRLIGLIGMMETAVKTTFTTLNEITKVIKDLEFYFENVIENDTTDVLIPEMKNLMKNIKGKAFEVLMQKKQKAFKNIVVNIQSKMPATLIAYKLYGEFIKNETDLMSYTAIIEGLNSEMPYHYMEGSVNAIEVTNG